MTARTCLYFIEPKRDRWFRGDHKWRAPVRRIIRGPDQVGGIKRVFLNLCLGLDRLGFEYEANLPFSELKPTDRVGVIGQGIHCLDGYNAANPILAGVGVNEHPLEFPDLFDRFPVSRVLVHCDWVREMYEKHYGPRVLNWPVGIDTATWMPRPVQEKSVDFLIYDKIRWSHDRLDEIIIEPIQACLHERGLRTETIRYGQYTLEEYRAKMSRARSLLFLCEHETQGIAYQEAMSSGLPVLAWDPGLWADPMRFRYGELQTKTTSVPFFDERCGDKFTSLVDFEEALGRFLQSFREGRFSPRDYILENLTLEKCSSRYLQHLAEVNS